MTDALVLASPNHTHEDSGVPVEQATAGIRGPWRQTPFFAKQRDARQLAHSLCNALMGGLARAPSRGTWRRLSPRFGVMTVGKAPCQPSDMAHIPEGGFSKNRKQSGPLPKALARDGVEALNLALQTNLAPALFRPGAERDVKSRLVNHNRKVETYTTLSRRQLLESRQLPENAVQINAGGDFGAWQSGGLPGHI